MRGLPIDWRDNHIKQRAILRADLPWKYLSPDHHSMSCGRLNHKKSGYCDLQKPDTNAAPNLDYWIVTSVFTIDQSSETHSTGCAPYCVIDPNG